MVPILISALILYRESQHPSVPYHYYEPTGPDECAMYISHERGRRGSHHRFITEKRVFANWARTFNIHFYQPDWSPPPLPRNNTATTAFPRSQKTWLLPEPSKVLKLPQTDHWLTPVALWTELYAFWLGEDALGGQGFMENWCLNLFFCTCVVCWFFRYEKHSSNLYTFNFQQFSSATNFHWEFLVLYSVKEKGCWIQVLATKRVRKSM